LPIPDVVFGGVRPGVAWPQQQVPREGFQQLPGYQPGTRPGKSVLVTTDGARGTTQLIEWLVAQRVQYSIGYALPGDARELIERIPPESRHKRRPPDR
jgi:hypothetical protein